MRCYDNMAYSEIAESMGCSEFSTRMLFVRAKKALQKELLSNGFSRGSLLAALIVFGKMTAPSKAAAAQLTVPAAALKVGLGGRRGRFGHQHHGNRVRRRRRRPDGRQRGGDLRVQAAGRSDGQSADRRDPGRQPVRDIRQRSRTILVLLPGRPGRPDDAAGPVRTTRPLACSRTMRPTTATRPGPSTINNHRMWLDDQSVLKLPTDSPELRGFLAPDRGDPQRHPAGVRQERPGPAGRDRAKDGRGRGRDPVDDQQLQCPRRRLLPERLADECPDRGQSRRDASAGLDLLPRSRHRSPDATSPARARSRSSTRASKQHQPWLRLKVGDLAIVDGGSVATIAERPGRVPVQVSPGLLLQRSVAALDGSARDGHASAAMRPNREPASRRNCWPAAARPRSP